MLPRCPQKSFDRKSWACCLADIADVAECPRWGRASYSWRYLRSRPATHLCNYHPGAHSALKIYRDRLFLLDLLQPQCIFYKIFRQKAIKMEDKEQPMILQITSMVSWFIYWSSATIHLNARDFELHLLFVIKSRGVEIHVTLALNLIVGVGS